MAAKGRYGYMKPGLEAEVNPTNIDVAWAAGLFEGEGSMVRTSPNRPSDGCEVACVSQKDPEILYRFKRLFGGNVYPDGGLYRWNVSGPRARGFLYTMFKFMSRRRKDQIRKVLGKEKHREKIS